MEGFKKTNNNCELDTEVVVVGGFHSVGGVMKGLKFQRSNVATELTQLTRNLYLQTAFAHPINKLTYLLSDWLHPRT